MSGLKLLVAMPALDEERTVGDVVGRVPREVEGIGEIRIVVIDDGSTDRTSEVARSAGAEVIRHERNRGVGVAFATALNAALDWGADLLVTLDSDGQFDPRDIPALIAPALADEADCTTASRFRDPSMTPQDMTATRRFGNRLVARIISRLAGRRLYDVSCGMRCYGRRALLELNPMASFTYTHEILLNLAFKHLRIVEVPVDVQGQRAHGKSRVAHNVVAYGMRSLWIIFRCYRDYRPMALFGSVAAALGGVGLLLLLFLLGHYVSSGQFSPHKWAGFTGAALVAVGLQVFFVGLIGDMMNRHRVYLEELLRAERGRGPRS